MLSGGPVRQLYARVNYIPQSETKNLATGDVGDYKLCEKILKLYDDNKEDCTMMKSYVL
jgi:hypothetical protein